MKLPVLVFDIETVLDLKSGATLYDLKQLDDANVYQALNKLRRQETGSDFQRLPLHEIICISGLWIDEKGMRLFSFSQQDNSESELLEKFLSIFSKRQPRLVSWNGLQFDLPVIMYRAMYYGLAAPNLFDQGELDYQRRFNNYQNRYHQKHVDLMDAMSIFNGRNFQKLNDISHFLGFPGVTNFEVHDKLQKDFEASDWMNLNLSCETHALNIWLIYLRWMLLKGQLSLDDHTTMIQSTRSMLSNHIHHVDFLNTWKVQTKKTVFTTPFFDNE